LIAYAAVCHVAATIGLGRHLTVVVEENPNHVINVALLCDIGEALAIMACTLGKTSFAVTLLRIVVHRWMIIVLWFVIVTMNLVNILAALFIFVQCKDPRHLWNTAIPSECWPADVFTHFSLFVGGMLCRESIFTIGLANIGLCSDYSLFWCARLCASSAALDPRLESSNEEKREDWYCFRYESGRVVSLPLEISLYVSCIPTDVASLKRRRGLNRQDNLFGGTVREGRLYL
jgi:hypothetical protein